MDANALQQAISNLGFPVVCCAALFWYMIKQADRHQKETNELKKSIDNNTLAITKLLERIGVEEDV